MVVGTVIYDACVLYPAPLRDLLVRLAMTGMFHARWTDLIHDEWTRNLLANRPDIAPEQLQRTRGLMNHHVRDSLVTGFDFRIADLQLPDPNDRHVLAAAIHADATAIVTYNLRDFPGDYLVQFGVAALHPDEFIVQLLDMDAAKVCGAIREQREARRQNNSVEQMLGTLARQQLSRTVERLRPFARIL